MKKYTIYSLFTLLFLILSIGTAIAQNRFYIDLNNRKEDVFHITLIPERLTEENKVFQFAATAPGTYEIMDIGRFVRSFKAFDKNGNELLSKQISTNQWELGEPVKTAKIEYTMADIVDTPVKEHRIYPMCATSFEDDHALINGHCVFGYFHGMQKTPIKIKLDFPSGWIIGTALDKDTDGFYSARDFDHVVDSPIELGNLTKASTVVENMTVNVYAYSESGKIKADDLMAIVKDIFPATYAFAQGLPAKRYDFLFLFEGSSPSGGAWEHNLSSAYAMRDIQQITPAFKMQTRSIAAHEFYHIITPLNIHSELIGTFNFEKPVMSQHLWFYEGVTEWAAQMLQLRGRIVSLEDYLEDLGRKLTTNDSYDPKLSLVELGIRACELPDQYPNIYAKGAVVGTLLDIDLLSLTNGTKGLREVINQLYKDYGVNKSFSEKNFFEEFVARTHPGIKDFLDRYIKNAEKLPVKEYFEKLGIDYREIAGYDSTRVNPGAQMTMQNDKFVIIGVDERAKDNLKPGDVMLKINGEELSMKNIQAKIAETRRLKAGESFNLTVEREGKQVEVKAVMYPVRIMHRFNLLPNPTPEQMALRNVWLKNL